MQESLLNMSHFVPTKTINIPNLLTLARFCLVPVVIVMITSQAWMSAFLVFVLAAITDAVDGYIARQFNQRTELGAYIDPLADKALLMSIYITLAIVGVIPIWLAIIVVARDIMILGAIMVSWLLNNPMTIEPLKISKANTFAQIAFAAMMLGTLAFQMSNPLLQLSLTIMVALLTISSMGAYLWLWLKHMA